VEVQIIYSKIKTKKTILGLVVVTLPDPPDGVGLERGVSDKGPYLLHFV
jgi:hypothetical protein